MTISNPAVARPSVRCSLSHDSFIARDSSGGGQFSIAEFRCFYFVHPAPLLEVDCLFGGRRPNNSRGQEELLLNRRKEAAFEGRQLKLKASRHRPK